MKNTLLKLVLLLYGFLLSHFSIGQSVATYGGGLSTINIASGGEHSTTEETLNLGPGDYQIDGTWYIYAKSIIIDPLAKIQGTGTIHIYNQAEEGRTSSRTYIDGNAHSTPINVNIVVNNANGIELKNQTFATDLSFSNNAQSSLYIGKDLKLAVDGADIWLGADAVGNLQLTNSATITNASAQRMIITNNSILSHVVRDAGSTGFFFPVGIADGDYTPAEITSNQLMNVSVTNYDNSAIAFTNADAYMNRAWHIYSNVATNATVILYHNEASTTTNGSTYVDNQASIVYYNGNSIWDKNSNTTFVATKTHQTIDKTISDSSSSNQAWLTKTSDNRFAPDLTPVIEMPLNLFVANESKNLVVYLEEVNGIETQSGVTMFSLTVPGGFEILPYNNTLTSSTPSGGSATPVSNNDWEVLFQESNQILLKAKAGVKINAYGVKFIGLSVKRTNAIALSLMNMTVDIVPDAQQNRYDSNNDNNTYSRGVVSN